jgi:hypothetical protein
MATSTLGNGTLVLAGTTSGTTTVTATAVAGTTTLTLPAATDTLVGRATTDTLTNKTLTGAAMNGTVGATTPSTGAFTTIGATGTVSASSGGIQINAIGAARNIFTNTVDGTDDGYVIITPGSSATTARGGYFAVAGNENSTFGNGGNAVITAGNVSGAKVKLQFNETDVAVVSSTGLAVTGLVDISAATSGQIKFPATQNASSNANTLDDYEEGTWTPSQGAGLTVVGAFSSSGSYTKIGRLVSIYGTVFGATSVATTAGTVMFGSLPFSAAEISPVGAMNNDNRNVFGGISVFGTTGYSATTIAAGTRIDFSITYSV